MTEYKHTLDVRIVNEDQELIKDLDKFCKQQMRTRQNMLLFAFKEYVRFSTHQTIVGGIIENTEKLKKYVSTTRLPK